jgi:nucleoid-associated protein YgaU
MGNFERLSVLVIVVIIVMIVVIALVQLTGGDEATPLPAEGGTSAALTTNGDSGMGVSIPPVARVAPPAAPGAAPAKPNPLFDFINSPRPTAPPEPLAAAPVEVAPTPPKPAEDKVHVVQSGETIAKIAKSYHPTSHARAVDAIVKANPSVDPARMRVGTKLTIPSLGAGTPSNGTTTGPSTASVSSKSSGTSSGSIAGGTYVVRKGDTLAAISRRAYGSTARWQDIWLANYEAIGDDVDAPTAGTRLTLPR